MAKEVTAQSFVVKMDIVVRKGQKEMVAMEKLEGSKGAFAWARNTRSC